jgi:hypothetical protein
MSEVMRMVIVGTKAENTGFDWSDGRGVDGRGQ